MVCSIGRLYAKVKDYATDNYYTQNQGLTNSQWYGQGAVILGLNGQVSTEEYNNAYQGLDTQGNLLRQGLIERGKLSPESQSINILKPKDLDKFSLTQANSYEVGDVIKFKKANRNQDERENSDG